MKNDNLIKSSSDAINKWSKVKSGVAGDTIFSAKMLIYISVLLEKLVNKPTKIINITIFGNKNKE
jgi:hypothetical protein